MRLQQHHSIGTRVVHLDEVEKIRHIAERLRHLLALGVDNESVMHPMASEFTAKCHRLRSLVFVMRKAKILTTAMQVKPIAEQPETHHHTLAMPAWTAGSPWRLPGRFTRLREFPESKICRVALFSGAEHLTLTPTSHHVVERLMGKQSVTLN